MKIKVLYIASRLRRQGPRFQLYNILKYIDRKIFNPIVLTLSPESNDSLLPDFRNLGINCYSFGQSRLGSILFGRFSLRHFLQTYAPDIIHASDTRSFIIAITAPENLPRIITRREAFYKHQILHHGVILGSIWEFIDSYACRRVQKIIAVSEFVRKQAIGINKSNIKVIYNGVDVEKYQFISDLARVELRERLRLPQDRKIFIYTGMLSAHKCPLVTIEGFLKSESAQQSILLMVGDGPNRDRCERFAKTNPNMRVVGFVNNVLDYLHAADFYVSSSSIEGCPNAMLEALACGLPVIVSDIDAHREIMKFNPGAGHLFLPNDISCLADKIDTIIRGDYSLLRHSALSIIHNHLNAARMASEYEKLYKEIYTQYSE